MFKQIITTISLTLISATSYALNSYYTVRLNNVYIGEFNFSHKIEDGEFEVDLLAETLGFGKSIIDAKFEGHSVGTGEQYRQYFPIQTSMKIQTPEYENDYQVEFKEAQFASAGNSQGEETKVDFSNFVNAVDPITAFAYVFRPIDYEHLCEMRVDVIDGLHHRRVILNEIETRVDGRLQCRGAVERVAGYSEADLTQKPFYSMIAVYQRGTEIEYYLDRMLIETPIGELEIAYEYEINASDEDTAKAVEAEATPLEAETNEN